VAFMAKGLKVYSLILRSVSSDKTVTFSSAMVQLSSKVSFAYVRNDTCKMHPKRMQNVSGTRAHETHLKCVWDGSVQVQNLVIKLQQDLINCHALFCHAGCVLNGCKIRQGCMTGTFHMRVNVTLELSCTIYTDYRKVPTTVTCWQIKSSPCLYILKLK